MHFRFSHFRLLAASVLFSVSAMLVAQVVRQSTQTGSTFVVNSLADTDDGSCDYLGQGSGNHDCTLREAINAVNGQSTNSFNNIVFGVSGTISLTSALPQLARNATVDGSGQSVTIDGGHTVIYLLSSSCNFQCVININALTISNAQQVGLYDSFNSHMTVSNCTLANNGVDSGNNAGGGILNSNNSYLVVYNSTFYGNQAYDGAALGITGGHDAYIYNCTFSNNYGKNGAIWAGNAAHFTNSIIAGNSVGPECVGSSWTNSMADDNTCSGATQVTVPQLNLATLANNGGPTSTIALQAGSVAIGAADTTACGNPPVNNLDQRGASRFNPNDGVCDLGAFEYTSPGPLLPLPAWRKIQFLAADGSQDLDNPSGDGIANLLKYAFNLAPNVNDVAFHNNTVLSPTGTAGLPLITRDTQGRWVIEFLRRQARSDAGVAYLVETGSDLTSLSALDLTTATVDPAGGSFERVTVTDPTVGPHRFVDVRLLELPVYFNDFNATLGAVTLYGTATWTNQAVQLTDNVAGSLASAIFNGITLGSYNRGFHAQFKLQLGPTTTGTPADGVSFAVGTLPAGTWNEGGPPGSHSIAVGFDTYDNGGTGSIGIHVWVNGTHVASNPLNPYTNGALVPVDITYDVSTGLTVTFNGTTVLTNVPIAGFNFITTDQFGFGARTGGATERAIIDDVQIAPR